MTYKTGMILCFWCHSENCGRLTSCNIIRDFCTDCTDLEQLYQSYICNQSVRRRSLRAGSSIVELEIDFCSSVQKLDGYLLSYTVTKPVMDVHVQQQQPHVFRQIVKTAAVPNSAVNHQICNKQSIDLESRGAQKWRSQTFRPSELWGKKKEKNLLHSGNGLSISL